MSGVVSDSVLWCDQNMGNDHFTWVLQRGFTLIEVMVTLAVLAILSAVAFPALQDFVERSAMRQLQSEFSASFQRARVDALSRNTCVSVCPLPAGGGAACETTAANFRNWHQGWLVFVNEACTAPANGVVPAADIIQVRQPGAARYTLIDQGGNPPALHTFNARGVLRATGRTLALADSQRDDSPHTRCMTINLQGRLLASRPDADGGC